MDFFASLGNNLIIIAQLLIETKQQSILLAKQQHDLVDNHTQQHRINLTKQQQSKQLEQHQHHHQPLLLPSLPQPPLNPPPHSPNLFVKAAAPDSPLNIYLYCLLGYEFKRNYFINHTNPNPDLTTTTSTSTQPGDNTILNNVGQCDLKYDPNRSGEDDLDFERHFDFYSAILPAVEFIAKSTQYWIDVMSEGEYDKILGSEAGRSSTPTSTSTSLSSSSSSPSTSSSPPSPTPPSLHLLISYLSNLDPDQDYESRIAEGKELMRKWKEGTIKIIKMTVEDNDIINSHNALDNEDGNYINHNGFGNGDGTSTGNGRGNFDRVESKVGVEDLTKFDLFINKTVKDLAIYISNATFPFPNLIQHILEPLLDHFPSRFDDFSWVDYFDSLQSADEKWLGVERHFKWVLDVLYVHQNRIPFPKYGRSYRCDDINYGFDSNQSNINNNGDHGANRNHHNPSKCHFASPTTTYPFFLDGTNYTCPLTGWYKLFGIQFVDQNDPKNNFALHSNTFNSVDQSAHHRAGENGVKPSRRIDIHWIFLLLGCLDCFVRQKSDDQDCFVRQKSDDNNQDSHIGIDDYGNTLGIYNQGHIQSTTNTTPIPNNNNNPISTILQIIFSNKDHFPINLNRKFNLNLNNIGTPIKPTQPPPRWMTHNLTINVFPVLREANTNPNGADHFHSGSTTTTNPPRPQLSPPPKDLTPLQLATLSTHLFLQSTTATDPNDQCDWEVAGVMESEVVEVIIDYYLQCLLDGDADEIHSPLY